MGDSENGVNAEARTGPGFKYLSHNSTDSILNNSNLFYWLLKFYDNRLF